MSKGLRVLMLSVVLTLAPGPAQASEEVTVSDLIQMSKELSDAEVTVEGELVGDYGFRKDDSVWSQLNGDSYARAPIRAGGEPGGGNTGVGIRIPAEFVVGLDPPGRYGVKGPVVRIEGTWKYHDPGRQGESYLQAVSLTLVEPGRVISEDTQWAPPVIGLVLLIAAAFVWRRQSE